ncbi:MAG: RNA polymerase sigma factor [Flavobacteriales bacterium]|nr:RNA polymerase sigma factor [Flavobacteriales bacterium]MBP9079145.1 RNA polymerase sigma factor [Flavobacteriales bacterium]
MVQTTTTLARNTTSETGNNTAWLDGLLRNDTRVVGQLYTAHFPAVRNYVLRNNGTVDEAKDIFQESFLVLWLHAKEGRLQAGTGRDPGGFLFQVARNKWLDVLRSAAKKHMRVLHSEHREPAPDQDGAIEDQLARLREVYGTLDDKCRQVLDRFYHERMDLASIAQEMGVAEESIRTIKYRCMMKLRAFRGRIAGDDQPIK